MARADPRHDRRRRSASRATTSTYPPFAERGGLGKAYELFGERARSAARRADAGAGGVSELPRGWDRGRRVRSPLRDITESGRAARISETSHDVTERLRVHSASQNIGEGVCPATRRAHIDTDVTTSELVDARRARAGAMSSAWTSTSAQMSGPRACLVQPWLGPQSSRPIAFASSCERHRPRVLRWMLNSPPRSASGGARDQGVGRLRLGSTDYASSRLRSRRLPSSGGSWRRSRSSSRGSTPLMRPSSAAATRLSAMKDRCNPMVCSTAKLAHWSTSSDVASVASDLVDPNQRRDQSPHMRAEPHRIGHGAAPCTYRTIAEDGVTSPKHRFLRGVRS